MSLPVYLAMSPWDLGASASVPKHLAYLSCHFSLSGVGLSNIPASLPPGSMVIVDDANPPAGHNPQIIVQQLQVLIEKGNLGGVLLDLQRPGNRESADMASAIVDSLNCPVGISSLYAKPFSCPVFLPPLPLHQTLEAYLAPWQGREIWLEVALDSGIIRVTPEGSRYEPCENTQALSDSLEEKALYCEYRISLSENQATFTLFRTPKMLDCLLQEAERLGINRAIGLYQELH